MQDSSSSEKEPIQDEIRELFEKNEWLYRVVADLGHEFRTPISGIVGLNEILLGAPANAQQNKYLKATQISSNGLLTMVNEFVDIARLDSGKAKLQLTSVRICEIFAECARSLVPIAEGQLGKLETFVDSALSEPLLLDANRIKQVISILTLAYLRIAESGTAVLTCEKTTAEKSAKVKFACKMSTMDNMGMADFFLPFTAAHSAVPPQQIAQWLRLRLAKRQVSFMSGRTSTSESADSFSACFELPLLPLPLVPHDH
jgi:K+-sensing histidine kinase KdpD